MTALALRTFGHMLAVLLKILRQVARTNAALLVAGYCVINELWIGQVQVRHNVLELLQGPFSPKPRIAFLFLRYRVNVPVLVVVRRVHQNIVGQGKQFLSDAFVQSARIAVLEVGTATPLDEKRISGKDPVAKQIREMPVSVAWRVYWMKRNATDLKRFAFFNAEVGARQPVVRRRGNFTSDLLFQLQPS